MHVSYFIIHFSKILLHLKNHHFKDILFKILVKTVKLFGFMKQFCMQLPISYCVILIMVTITRHIFINIFQSEQHFALMGFDKN